MIQYHTQKTYHARLSPSGRLQDILCQVMSLVNSRSTN